MNKQDLIINTNRDNDLKIKMLGLEKEAVAALPDGFDYANVGVYDLNGIYGDGGIRLNSLTNESILELAKLLPPEPLMLVKNPGWALTLRPSCRYKVEEQERAEKAFEVVPYFINNQIFGNRCQPSLEWYTRMCLSTTVLLRVRIPIQLIRDQHSTHITYGGCKDTIMYWNFGTRDTLEDILNQE